MNTPDRLELLRAAARRAPCTAALGLTLVEAGEGTCRILARHDPAFDGLVPGFHGGMQAAVADCVAWYAIATVTGPEEPLVTTDLSIRYLSPAIGDLTLTGRVIKLGKTLCPVAIEAFDTAGKLVACGTVTYLRLGSFQK